MRCLKSQEMCKRAPDPDPLRIRVFYQVTYGKCFVCKKIQDFQKISCKVRNYHVYLLVL